MDPPADELIANYEATRDDVGDLKTRVRQLIVFYIFAEIVALLSIRCPSSVTLCRSQWIPFSLLASISTVFWLLIVPAAYGFLQAQLAYDRISMEQEIMFCKFMLQKCQSPPRANNSRQRRRRRQRRQEIERTLIVKPDATTRYIYAFGIVSALLAFTVLVFYDCHAVLLRC